jgi:hypothetical protein
LQQKLNGTHQLLAYADDKNVLRDNTDIKIQKTCLMLLRRLVQKKAQIKLDYVAVSSPVCRAKL